MTILLYILRLIVGSPLAPISYPACFVGTPGEADLVAREVRTVAEATWCITPTNDCNSALILIYRKPDAKDTYVVSDTCSVR